MRKYIYYILLALGCLSCNNEDAVKKQIVNILNSESKDISKLNRLSQLIKECPSCIDSLDMGNIFLDGQIDRNELEKFYFEEKIDTSRFDIKAKIFLENSASMWGYFNGQTDAEKVVSRVLLHSDLLFGSEGIEFSFITDSVYQNNSLQEEELEEYILRLEPNQMRIGNVGDTKIADIIKRVLKNTEPNELSVLFSDCIYSVGRKNSLESVNNEWTLIEAAFARMLKKSDVSVFIVKYQSQFKGYYYSLTSNGGEEKTYLGNDGQFKRPLYAIVLGESKLLKSALQEIDFKSYTGYINSYLISPPQPSGRIDYRVSRANSIGRYTFDREDKRHSIVDAEKIDKGPNAGYFQYSVLANLKGLGIENEYLIDTSKYDVSGQYTIGINELEMEEKKSNAAFKDYSHLITLKTSGNPPLGEVSISLRRETPRWVEDTHTDDDSNFSEQYQNKTRGFKYFINGIENAYEFAYKSENTDFTKYYFTLTTNIR